MTKTNFEKIKEMDIDCFALWLVGIGGKCSNCSHYQFDKSKCNTSKCLEYVKQYLKESECEE